MTFLSGLYDTANAFIIAQLGEMGPLIVAGARSAFCLIPGGPAFDPVPQEGPARQAQGHAPRQRCHRLPRTRCGGAARTNASTVSRSISNRRTRPSFSAAQFAARAGRLSVQGGPCRPSISPSFALGIGGLLLGTLYVVIAGGGSAQASILSVLVPGCVGYYAPKYWVQRRVQSR